MQTIMCCVDFSTGSDVVLEQALEFATLMNAEIRVIHVLPPENDVAAFSPDTIPLPMVSIPMPVACRDKTLETKRLEAMSEKCRARNVTAKADVLEALNNVHAILAEADHCGARMIVMGSHGHGALYDLVVGSTAEGVMRQASVPVVVVPCRK